MNNETTLRDWLAMNAPFIQALSTGSSDSDMERHVRERYRYADIARRVRDETMPKVEGEPEFNYEAWRKYAERTGWAPPPTGGNL